MQLNKLERIFFDRILCADLNTPIHGELDFGTCTFPVIVVPEINPKGYFCLKYYDAPAYQPLPVTTDSGTSYVRSPLNAAKGVHPEFQRAWQDRTPVELHLKGSNTPFRSHRNPTLRVRILIAESGHKGKLALHENRVMLRNAYLTKSEFSISGFADFMTPEWQFSSVRRIYEDDYQHLLEMSNKLQGDAKITIAPASRSVLLDSGDGWQVTLTKDEKATRASASHTGVVERSDGQSFNCAELNNFMEGLRYFFAFTMVQYCSPSVLIGYDATGQAVWGEVGGFEPPHRPTPNWFKHPSETPSGQFLEHLFPEFWRRWKDHKLELMAAIDCYAISDKMRRAGLQQDAVAKICGGLEILASLTLEKTIERDPRKDIHSALELCCVPNRDLDPSKHPITRNLVDELTVESHKGAHLLVDVRNYIAHPLDRNEAEPKIKPGHVKYLDSDYMRYFHLQDLGQFYLEHLLLAFCGFKPSEYRILQETRFADSR